MATETIKMQAGKVIHENYRLIIRIKGLKRMTRRIWLMKKLMYFAALVGGLDLQIEFQEKEGGN